jgi:hypothetical protein
MRGECANIPGGGNRPSGPRRQPHRPDRGQIAKYRIPAGCAHELEKLNFPQELLFCDLENLRDLSTGVQSGLLSERHVEGDRCVSNGRLRENLKNGEKKKERTETGEGYLIRTSTCLRRGGRGFQG